MKSEVIVLTSFLTDGQTNKLFLINFQFMCPARHTCSKGNPLEIWHAGHYCFHTLRMKCQYFNVTDGHYFYVSLVFINEPNMLNLGGL